MQLTELGKELRKLRVDLDINLADMANTIGVSPAFYPLWKPARSLRLAILSAG